LIHAHRRDKVEEKAFPLGNVGQRKRSKPSIGFAPRILGKGEPMRVSTLATLVFLAFSAPASANDNETANRLFVEAVLKWKEATAIPDEGLNNAEVRVALLAAVANNLEQIIVAAPGSNLAVQLVLDEQIGPLSVAQVAEALASAQGILETEREREQCFSASSRQCVLILALQSAQTIEDAFPRGLALRNVAVAQAEAGMFTAALQTAQTIEDAYVRVRALTSVTHAGR
jgi:hypothetical protein